ncbi:MAG: hypothetical protein L0Z62_35975 [Gemmataceae bacterium]|nr:hypothetical protein [Gemmataceae bacterium]
MAGPESAVGMILFVLLGFGSNSRDLVSYLNVDDYFKSRKVEVTVERMLDLAAKSPMDGKDQVMQLLAIRKLTANPAEAKKDRRVRALLEQIAQGKKGKDRLGFAEDYARRALAQLDGKQIAAATMPKNSLRADAFQWFPRDTALVAGVDLRPVEGVAAVEVGALQELVTKFTRESNMEELFEFVETVGNIRLDRFSIGIAPDPQGGRNARIYVRVSGKADHRRLVNFLRESMKVAIVREERGPDQEPITFLRAADQPPALAVVGDSELLIAGYLDDQGDHLAVVREMLEVRSGKQRGVAAGPLAAQLKKTHPQTFILVAGDITKELGLGPIGGAPGIDGKGTLPRTIVMETTRKAAGLDILVEAVMENAGDAQRLAEEATRGLREGIEEVRRELTRKPDVPKEAVELITKTMETIKVQAKGASLNISGHVSNDVMKAVPDLLNKIGAFPGGPRRELPKEFNEIKELKKAPERERRNAPPPPGTSGRRAARPALGPMVTAAVVACPRRTAILQVAPLCA